jgi:tetratricopeptide (TPR) repeat protein
MAELGDTDEALDWYDKAIKADAKYAPAHYNKGVLLDKKLRPDEALKCLDNAIKIEPKKDNPKFYKGIVLGKMKKHEEALNCFQNVYRNNRNHLDAYFQTGIQLAELDRHEQALKVFDSILERYQKYKDNPHFIYAKSRSKAALNETAEALTLLKIATKSKAGKIIKKWAAEDKAFDKLVGIPEFENIIK